MEGLRDGVAKCLWTNCGDLFAQMYIQKPQHTYMRTCMLIKTFRACVFVRSDQEQFETLDRQQEMAEVTVSRHVRRS